MKIKNILIGSALCIAALASYSCSDKLDISQHGVLNYETYYQNDEQIEAATAAIYLEAKGWNYDYYVRLMKEMLTDDFYAGGADRGDNIDLQQLNEFTFDTEQDYIQAMFTSLYTLIYKCNVVLGHVSEDQGDVAKRSLAEARVLRAWAYFDLITIWGNPPVVDHELVPSEYSRPNGTTEELWALVENDLKEAIASNALPEKSGVNDNETWRTTKQFAQALLGKAYLWQEKYDLAAEMFDAVVNSGKYALYTGNYADMHRNENKHFCESIFETNRVADEANPYSYNFSLYHIMINWRVDRMSGVSGNEILQTGWGFRVPTKDLYDAFVKDEGENGYRLNQTLKTYQQVQDQMGIKVTANVINEGYFMWKDIPYTEDRGTASDYYYAANLLWMRYAEVLLCGAEAHLMAGNTEKAKEYTNMIRSRAGLSPLGTVTLDDIKLEKRLELCGEGTRFQDLLRWGDAAKVMANNGKTYPVLQPNGEILYKECNNTTYGFKTGKHEHLPYPATEIRLNSEIQQNPGY